MVLLSRPRPPSDSGSGSGLVGVGPGWLRQRAMVITGPNMGGKSSLIRQTALIVLMAQVRMRAHCPPPCSPEKRVGGPPAVSGA